MPTAEAVKAEETLIHVLWINAGLSCDGDSVSLTAATQPSIEEIALGALPGLPQIAVHWPLIDFECGPNGGADDFLEWFFKADRGELEPFVLVVEGSIPNEQLHDEGYWCGFGNNPATGQPMTTSEWLDRLAPKATAIVAVGTCATYGGIHAMAGNPTGAMGVPDYLGWDWKSKAGIPIVCVPGCPAQPDNMAETLTYLLYMATGQAPMIPLDDALRPTWLFGQTVHEGCDRAGYYEQGDFATEYGSPKCIVKLGCWGPTVKCNVPKRGWMNGVGGCPNVGGICIGCTMPGFPDKFMPFMDEPPGGKLSTATVGLYGNTMRRLRHDHHAHPGQGAQVAQARQRAHHRRHPHLVTLHDPATTTAQEEAADDVDDPITEQHEGRLRRARGDGVGPHHPDRRQPRDLHQDRLQPEGRRRVQEHQLDLPRLLDLHEGQGPARRALHHQPHLRHLWRQPRDLFLLLPEHGVRREAAAPRRVDRQPRRGRGVHVRPQHLPGEPGRGGLLREDGRRDQPGRAREGQQHRGPALRRARLPAPSATSCGR